ncbi:MAG: hypothetical protein FWC20_02870 [Oscillospiraceae bacterium]|nr:hypothetical protein [Oscillospiraceae bacterium]MCL2278338.1 hypothetical protein [Oscillospiraceae bacterium]
MNNNDNDMKIDDLSNLGNLASIDDLIDEASVATDKGDYEAALRGFEQALNATQKIFGDNIELKELKHRIAEVKELLGE